MDLSLNPEDRRAVDLLLDRSSVASANGNANSSYTTAASSVPQDRLAAAERLLSLLQWLPAAEPPKDLAARTMRFVKSTMPAAMTPGDGISAPLPHLMNPSHSPHA